jgi:hypothetical protein
MRSWVVLVLAVGGCGDIIASDETARGWSKTELEAGPSDKQLHAAILSDVRRWRVLEQRLDEGQPTCTAWKAEREKTLCVADQAEMTIFNLRTDLQDQPYRVEESAYYCPKESVYYYHYAGGPRRLDVWLGPFKIDRPARKLDDYK